MPIKDSRRGFGWLTIANHWVSTMLIASLLYVGFYMAGLPRGSEKIQMIGVHKALGITVLILALMRISWRTINPMPMMLGSPPLWHHVLARGVQFILLALILLMPITGWMMSSAGGHPVSFFGLITLPELIQKNKHLGELLHEIHRLMGFAILVVLGVHVMAAFKHTFVDRDSTLKRMLGLPGVRD